jgi:dimethylhistidine N-methyltransferase
MKTLTRAQPTSVDVTRAALAGLNAAQKTLPCSLFYDNVGAALFKEICQTPEYYPTRTEIGILRDQLPSISAAVGSNTRLIELGSGDGVKPRILLSRLDVIEYVAVDISRDQLLKTAEALALMFPRMRVQAICADYTKPLLLPAAPANSNRTVIFFPGSTIGNFEPADAEVFLRSLADLAGELGGLLIGVDLHKDRDRLNAAYNDARGTTAAFNLNILAVLNRLAGANFDLTQFKHEASYDERHRRIEMRLISRCKQQVRFALDRGVPDAVINFAASEPVVTEHSYKYSLAGFAALVSRAGWTPVHIWVDAERLFAVYWCVCKDPSS